MTAEAILKRRSSLLGQKNWFDPVEAEILSALAHLAMHYACRADGLPSNARCNCISGMCFLGW